MGCLRITYRTDLKLIRGHVGKLPREEKACRAEPKSDAVTILYYYGARYYDPAISLWLSVDPLAGYNPVGEVEHYIDGEHNGGVFNSMNNNPYIYTYQNPIKYIDPNGKQSIAPAMSGYHASAVHAANVGFQPKVPSIIKQVANNTINYVKENKETILIQAKSMQKTGDDLAVGGLLLAAGGSNTARTTRTFKDWFLICIL